MKLPSYHTVQVFLKSGIKDTAGIHLREKIMKYLNIETGKIRTGKIYVIDYPLQDEELQRFANEGLSDVVVNEYSINAPLMQKGFDSYIIIAKLPGVTDDEGMSAQKTLIDMFSPETAPDVQKIFSQDFYLFENILADTELQVIADTFLANKLINHISTGRFEQQAPLYVPEVHLHIDNTVEAVPVDLEDDELLALSSNRLLALNLEEMRVIKSHYLSKKTASYRKAAGLPEQPTDCDLEIIAQTWSEHCKHKEFNAEIIYIEPETGRTLLIDSLFKAYIKNATQDVQETLEKVGLKWLVKVFSDNAGVVKINDEELFVWKVETHNSPSAMDPYGGAITGILGNNRDPLGTGIGGAKLLFNTNVLCFGPPSYSKSLLTGQLHPRRIFEGVRKGIEDGGNKSGIPTVNGSVIFDDRYSGKPLVYCGTGGIMPAKFNGRDSWVKEITPGSLIVSIGGRVGKDGIHGATFSSREIDEHSPQSAVQIGSPIVQKMAADFLEKAAHKGLIQCSTDCGAGGLSSAIGELATISDGAEVYLEKVKLKYSGLKPWEIFLSESQERMILAVLPEHLTELLALARHMESEYAVIGKFTGNGYLKVMYGGEPVSYLPLEFLHNGVPKKYLKAEWRPVVKSVATIPQGIDYTDMLLRLMGSDAISSREYLIRQYDHEVKGKTIIKPLMGKHRSSPQDAAVVRTGFASYEGIAVSNGIMPKYVEIDPYMSSAAAFDEAVRQIIAIGGKLPLYNTAKSLFWSVNDNFCVPDSVWHPENNPDGKRKLGQLVQMCEALYDMSTFYAIPMTSGKDSMKNDFKSDGIKISVPPTLLYSMAAKIEDVRKTVTAEFKTPGDLIYVIGRTHNEPGESEFFKLLGLKDTRIPMVRKEIAARTYRKMMHAHERGMIHSAHDISDGGMIVTLAECCFGNMLGADIVLPVSRDMSAATLLFSESHSRFVVTVKPKYREKFEEYMGGKAHYIGVVTAEPEIIVTANEEKIINCKTEDVYTAWKTGLTRQVI